MSPKLPSLVPRHKHDIEAAEVVTQLGFCDIQPFLPELLEWLQDTNWPVAQVLAPHFSGIGSPLAPYLRPILGGSDGAWKYNLIYSVILPSHSLCESLASDLERLAFEPTEEDEREEANLAAAAALQELDR